jgi:outer membrane protein assembly factor BamB
MANRPWWRMGMACVVVLAVGSTALAQGQDWPRYQGADFTGVSTEAGWDSDWSDGKPSVAWTKQVGKGANSMVVVNGMLITSGFASGKNTVYVLNAKTGSEIWSYSYATDGDNGFGRTYPGGAQGTPTVDGDRVYVVGQRGKLLCLDIKKKQLVWQRDLKRELGGKHGNWGYAFSPLVVGDKLIIDVGSSKGSTVALDKNTGKIKWAAGKDKIGYSSPVIHKLAGRDMLLIHKAQALVALNPESGREYWRYRWPAQYGISAPLPIVFKDHVFLTTGYNKGSALLKVSRSGVIKVYDNRELSAQMASPILYKGHIYVVTGNNDRGDLACFNFETGKEMWRDETFGAGSIKIAGGQLIALSEKGQLRVGPASPKGFAATGTMQALNGRCWVAPVLSHGRIYCKNNDGKLVCIDVSK